MKNSLSQKMPLSKKKKKKSKQKWKKLIVNGKKKVIN